MRLGAQQPRVRQGEKGAAWPLVAMSLAMLIVAALLLGAVGERVRGRAQAQSAADAAALAGAIEGRSGAERLAAANGARLVTFDASGNHVRVVVERAGHRASASAERRLVHEAPKST